MKTKPITVVTDSRSNAVGCSLAFEEDRVGVAKNKSLGFAVLFKRGRVKLSTKYRVWPVPGDDRFMELDPSEWRDKFTVIAEHKNRNRRKTGVKGD